MTHDYKRNGTTTLFAALKCSKVIGRCMQRHRHQEFIRFLNAIERTVPAGKLIHVVLDNYGAHKQAKVRQWLARHPRWIFHFTPTSCSWLNAVETVFSALSRRRLKRGVFRSIVDLQAAIHRYIAEHNADPKPRTRADVSGGIAGDDTPLAAARLHALYSDAATYRRRVEQRLDELTKAGWFLPEYREQVLGDAAARLDAAC